mmetsp:Transcript_41413/g.107288  ORF Transcript_41413/g.107288 Transcript_41413/m.107288 type:complete len:140 (+) Transcript_41413:1189-1608(+)
METRRRQKVPLLTHATLLPPVVIAPAIALLSSRSKPCQPKSPFQTRRSMLWQSKLWDCSKRLEVGGRHGLEKGRKRGAIFRDATQMCAAGSVDRLLWTCCSSGCPLTETGSAAQEHNVSAAPLYLEEFSGQCRPTRTSA